MFNAYSLVTLIFVQSFFRPSFNQESIAFINDGTEPKDDSAHISDFDDNAASGGDKNGTNGLPIIESIKHEEMPANRFLRTLAISIPFIIFLVNQFWIWSSPDVAREWCAQNQGKLRENLGLAQSQEINFRTIDTSHQIALLESNSQIRYFKIEIENLYRQDIFYAFWNKIHNNFDRIEFTAVLKTKEPFSLYLGRKSALINSTDLTNLKNVCNDYNFCNLSQNFICLTEVPNPLEIFSQKFVDILKSKHAHFNYFYVTDLVNCNDHIPVNSVDVQDYVVVKISLVLTSMKFWGFEFNDFDDLFDEFFVVLKNILSVRLSSPVKSLIDKSRQKLLEHKSKEEHIKRQEIAMKKKDEKVRAMKEKIMSESDEKKQIKLQEKFERYEAKEKNKKLTKGKSIKVIS